MQRRQGFTLIEMLVSMALTIFLMVILAQCFVAGLDTFRQLKAVGDMEANLRTASAMLRRDLASDHFEGKKRVSDPQFWALGPPREGFLRIIQGSPPKAAQPAGYYIEGADADGIPSSSAIDHVLHFAVKLRGNQRPNFFSAKIGDPNSPLFTLGQPDSRFQGAANTSTYNSAWAEVAFFLNKTGLNANGNELYALYRRQLLAVPNSDGMNWTNPPPLAVPTPATAAYQQVSCWFNGVASRMYFNSPTDLTIPERRFGKSAIYQALGTGDDLLLTNVISFEVKVLLGGPNPGAGFVSLYDPSVTRFSNNNPLYTRVTGPRVFDTWTSLQDDTDNTNYTSWKIAGSAKSIPLYQNPAAGGQQISIAAISITLRVWDTKTEQTRQITIVQDM
jgi:prepilin-type N-terminal cleavage/methylation domain-containing protein